MNQKQINLLVYLETCMVDYGGKVEARRINGDDYALMEAWKKEGLIKFGRLFASEANKEGRSYVATHWVLFTEKAWELAHQYRRERAARLIPKVNRNDPDEQEEPSP